MEVWNQHKKYDDDTCDILGCLVLFITSYDIIYVSVKVYKFDYRKFVMKWSDLHLKKKFNALCLYLPYICVYDSVAKSGGGDTFLVFFGFLSFYCLNVLISQVPETSL